MPGFVLSDLEKEMMHTWKGSSQCLLGGRRNMKL